MAFMAEGIYTMGRSGPTRCEAEAKISFLFSLFNLILARIDVLIPVSCWYFYFILPSVERGKWKYILILWRCVFSLVMFVTCIDRAFPATAASILLTLRRASQGQDATKPRALISQQTSVSPAKTHLPNAKDNVIALAFDYWSTSRFFDIEHITARVSLGRKETTVAFSFPFDCI